MPGMNDCENVPSDPKPWNLVARYRKWREDNEKLIKNFSQKKLRAIQDNKEHNAYICL